MALTMIIFLRLVNNSFHMCYVVQMTRLNKVEEGGNVILVFCFSNTEVKQSYSS